MGWYEHALHQGNWPHGGRRGLRRDAGVFEAAQHAHRHRVEHEAALIGEGDGPRFVEGLFTLAMHWRFLLDPGNVHIVLVHCMHV